MLPASYCQSSSEVETALFHETSGCTQCASKMFASWNKRKDSFDYYTATLKRLDELRTTNDLRLFENAQRDMFQAFSRFKEDVKEDERIIGQYLKCGHRLALSAARSR